MAAQGKQINRRNSTINKKEDNFFFQNMILFMSNCRILSQVVDSSFGMSRYRFGGIELPLGYMLLS